VEYTASYAYHALFSYFDRDTVGLSGFAKFFAQQSREERSHAEEFMKYQNIRGGKVTLCMRERKRERMRNAQLVALSLSRSLAGFRQVVLKPLAVPDMQFSRVDGTSDALYAFELALMLEKFVYRCVCVRVRVSVCKGKRVRETCV
jgi:hypothetical protein